MSLVPRRPLRAPRFTLPTLLLLLPGLAFAARFTDFALDGKVVGDNIDFELRLGIEELSHDDRLEALRGDVALRESHLPNGMELVRDGGTILVTRAKGGWWGGGAGTVTLRFAARPSVSNEWRSARFQLPVLPVRSVTVSAAQPQLDIELPGAANIVTVRDPEGRPTTTANLAIAPEFSVFWKPEIRQVDSELVATCDIHTVASASPGTLRIDSVYTYRVAQGQLSELLFDLPDVNVLSISGADIQDWRVDRADPAQPRLRVQLARPNRDEYRLGIVCERPLDPFPCQAALPVLVPRGVIRAGGNVLLGTDSAVKLQVSSSAGLTQIDSSAFPRVNAVDGNTARPVPARGVFAWQYAAVPYELTIAADDIATAVHADVNLLVNIVDGIVTADAALQLDVRDAPSRELRLRIPGDPRWTVVSVSGRDFSESDVDTRAVEAVREIVIPFRAPVEGQTMVNVRLEAQLAALGEGPLSVPSVEVVDARAQRGYIVAAAERGIRLTPHEPAELNDIHTASAPFKAEGAQLAYRFRDASWKLSLKLEYARSSIHSEVFHLVSIGQGVVYVSAAVNGHVSGAPVQMLQFHVPSAIQGLDVTGVGLDTWSRSNDVCTVRLANRVLGDFTLLLSYDHPVAYDNVELTVGEIETIGTASELGFIAVATSAPLRVEEGAELPASLIRIPRDELPAGYAATVTAPVVGAWKYTRAPHAAKVRIAALDSHRPIDQVVDFLALHSTIGRDGESVTRATWQVKNTSRQYLEIQLPPNATVWSVRQGADSATRDLPAQQTGDRLLVPVERPRDPNQAVSIEVVYAQPSAKPRRFGPVSLTAPRLPGAPVTFASWEVASGDRRAFARATGGAMTAEQPRDYLFPFAFPRRDHSVRRFYRTTTLAGEEALHVVVTVVPRILGGTSLPLVGAAAGAGLLGFVLAVLRRPRRRWFALGLAGAWFAALQLPTVAEAAVTVGRALIPLAVFVAILRGIVRAVRRRAERPPTPPLREAPPRPPSPDVPEPSDEAASPPSAALFALLAAGLLLGASAGRAEEPPACPPAIPPVPLLQALTLEVAAPLPGPHDEPTATVRWALVFRTEESDQQFLLLPHQPVLTESSADGERYGLEPTDGRLVLRVRDRGDHTFRFATREPLVTRDGYAGLSLSWFPNVLNTMTLTVPATDLDVRSPHAAWLTTTTANGSTTAELSFVPAATVDVTWRPRARDTRAETPVVYADIASVARLRPGVVETTAQAVFNVVQGETRLFTLRLPENTTATDVVSPALATWRFDPATRRIEAVMSRPQTGSVRIDLTLQTPCAPPPAEFVLAAPSAENVERQRGRFAVAAPESLLLRFGDLTAVTPIDTSDFATLDKPSSRQQVPGASSDPVRRAFRYDDPVAVRIALALEEVQPELRLEESTSFSLGDERSMLSSSLQLTVARAGVFGVQFTIPKGYEVESLTGTAVSHWDDSRAAGRGIEVWFNRRVQDTTPINLVLAAPMRGVSAALDVPRIELVGARRHTGRLAVVAERGIKLTVDTQSGVTARRDEAQRGATLVFDILRPDWRVALKTEVLPPILKPDLLHRVELAEGMLQHRLHVHYRIANAGVRFFRIRVPVKDATLTVSGRHIARVRPLEDVEAGDGRVWEIELHGKVEGTYDLVGQYQEPFDPAAKSVVIKAVTLLDTARQAGWLAVTCPGRVEVAPQGDPAGLKDEDARALPATFNAGDLSSAILCYRTLRDDYTLPLSVVRHAAAQVLPANVESVRLVSVLSGGGRLLAQATLTLDAGHMRFLRVKLPSSEATLWSALVNGAEVSAATAEDVLNIPLESATVGQRTTVTLVYADALPGGRFAGHQTLRAPTFPDLPLRDIEWRLFVPPDFAYHFPRGAFDREEMRPMLRTFGKGEYDLFNKNAKEVSVTTARSNLAQLDNLLQTGQQMEARKVLQQAVTLSQAEESLNEDARVQFRNVVQQQVKMGLVNRRAALRSENNIFDGDSPAQQQAGWNEGNFDATFARQVEEQLDASDRAGLELVAQKLVEVQAGATAQGTAIQVAMPQHGKEFSFRRALQNELGGELAIVFDVRPPRVWAAAFAFWPILPGFLLLWLLLRLFLGPARDA